MLYYELNSEKTAAFLLFYKQMKNNTVLIFAVSILFIFALGCGISDKPVSEKIGIPQCDEVFDMLTEQIKPQEDETYISKATKEFYLNKIRESFRESIKNEKDRDKLAENCTQYLEQLKKHKAEEDGKK